MWDFRRSVPKTSARKKGQLGDQTTCKYMWSHGTMWHSTIPSVVRAWFDIHSRMITLFLAPYSSFLNRIFLSLEMEGFWVPPGSNGCWMPRYHSWIIPGRIRHIKRVFPRCLASEDIRYLKYLIWRYLPPPPPNSNFFLYWISAAK